MNIDLTRSNAPGIDPLFTRNQSFFNPHLGAGLNIQNEKFFISLSTPNFLNGERFERQGNVPTAAIDQAHFYIGGGYNIDFNENLTISPRVMVRSVEGAPASYDLGATAELYKKFTVGANVRLDETLSIYSLINVVNKLKLGVGYDITTASELINDDGSIEFILKYQF